MKKLSPTELAWVAGLLEGEGCFFLKKMHSERSVYPGMEVRCNMTDRDVVYRLYELCGGRFRGPIQKQSPTKSGKLPKPQWLWTLGRRAGCEDLMRQLHPLMGERRAAKIREILAAGEAHPAKGWRHGRTAWETKRCDCDVCHEAFNKRHRDYRARRKARQEEAE